MQKPSVLKSTGLFEDEAEDMFSMSPIKSNSTQTKDQTIKSPQPVASSPNEEERPWLREGLIIKCVNGELAGGRYVGKMGVVQKTVEGGFGGEIRMTDSLDILLLDQDDCRPVLPAPGNPMMVLATGEYTGSLVKYVELAPGGRDVVVEVKGRRTVALPIDQVCAVLPSR